MSCNYCKGKPLIDKKFGHDNIYVGIKNNELITILNDDYQEVVKISNCPKCGERLRSENAVKYQWTLMHGDANKYEDKELILEDSNDIALFDYIWNLEFVNYDCEGLKMSDDDEKNIIQLFKATEFYDEEYFDEDDVRYELSELLSMWEYIEGDCTCDGFHYASINYKKRIKD